MPGNGEKWTTQNNQIEKQMLQNLCILYYQLQTLHGGLEQFSSQQRDQIIVIVNGLLLYETRRCNSSDCISSQDFRLVWASDKIQGDFFFLLNLSEILLEMLFAGCINLVIDISSYCWHFNIYVTVRVLYILYFFPSCLLHWCFLPFICLQVTA